MTRLSLYKACALLSVRQIKTFRLSLGACLIHVLLTSSPFFHLSTFLRSLCLFFICIPSFTFSKKNFHHTLLFFFCSLAFTSLSHLPLSHPSCLGCLSDSASFPSPSHSGTQLSDIAVNPITLTRSEFSVRGHFFKAVVGYW